MNPFSFFRSGKGLILPAFLLAFVFGFIYSCAESKDVTLSDLPTVEPSEEISFRSTCEPCENGITVLLKGLDNYNNACLDNAESFVYYESYPNNDIDSVNFQNLQQGGTGQTGYIAWLQEPADICSGSTIRVKLKKFPAVGSVCLYDCFKYDVFLFTGGLPIQTKLCSEIPHNNEDVFFFGVFEIPPFSETLKTCRMEAVDTLIQNTECIGC